MEFLSLGIGYGQRVTLTLKDINGETRSVDCHFAGFRFFMGRATCDSPGDIIPVFNATSKNGKMLNRHIYEHTKLDNIISIKTAEATGISSLPGNIPSLGRAVDNIEKTSRHFLEMVLKEMSVLFPGKKIRFDMDDRRNAAVYYYKHDSDVPDITAVCFKDGKVRYELEGEYTNEQDVTDSEIDVFSYTRILETVLENIRRPYVPEGCEDNFFSPDEQSWKDIPDVDPDKQPYLHSTLVLEELKADLWFESLSDEEKEAQFNGLKNTYEHTVKEHPENSRSFVQFINSDWERTEPRWKVYKIIHKKNHE